MKIKKIEYKELLTEKRVAAYARVSTVTEEQEESFETQVNYYTTLIEHTPGWKPVKVYADSGRSGTSADKRPGFMEMIRDARARKIDVILVKSISRFARNVVDALNYVHELKELEIEVRFEREGISSFDPSAEMVFNILAAVAQEESRSISENVKWSYRKQAEKGVRHIGNGKVLGFDEVDGVLIPNDQAWIVRKIFTDYGAGLTCKSIQNELNHAGAKTQRGNEFSSQGIRTMLNNELYVGDKRIQKQPPLNYLTKKPDVSAAYDSYYVTDDHKGIVSRALWDTVQARNEREKQERANGLVVRSTCHFLYGKVFCAECGKPYKRRTIVKKGESQKFWNCADRQKGKDGNGCKNRNISEDELLSRISGELGWIWNGSGSFDAEAFLEQVQRVEIARGEMRVLRRKVI